MMKMNEVYKNLRVEELMIGDFVYKTYPNKHIVEWSYIEMFDSHGRPIAGRDIEPIPLTNEFLEMNGFKKGTERFWHKQCEEDFRLLIDTQALNNLLYKEKDALLWVFTDGFCELRTKVRFVHELQHAMRVMGIKKEFELKKIF
jgi:hypothetical protein